MIHIKASLLNIIICIGMKVGVHLRAVLKETILKTKLQLKPRNKI